MKHQILNYLIIIQPDTRTGTNQQGFSVYCPSLGLADGGDTVEEAIVNMKKMIRFHLECLEQEEEAQIFGDSVESIVTTAQIKIPA